MYNLNMSKYEGIADFIKKHKCLICKMENYKLSNSIRITANDLASSYSISIIAAVFMREKFNTYDWSNLIRAIGFDESWDIWYLFNLPARMGVLLYWSMKEQKNIPLTIAKKMHNLYNLYNCTLSLNPNNTAEYLLCLIEQLICLVKSINYPDIKTKKPPHRVAADDILENDLKIVEEVLKKILNSDCCNEKLIELK